MYHEKKVLLIGGGGTLGTYTAEELLRLGCRVDVICLEQVTSNNDRLRFFQMQATYEALETLLKRERYDGIVNFIHYPDVEEYKPVHRLLTEETDIEHLIFLSSYRVYADMEHPVTENAPILLDVSRDEQFLATEKYALSKAKAEKFLRASGATNWTAVRPVISFSKRRFDVVTRSGREVIECAQAGKPVFVPLAAKHLTAGLDWAGNSGKLIAHLLFKKEAMCESFTISSAQNLTWGEVADLYTELIGAQFEWLAPDEYFSIYPGERAYPYTLVCDRLYDRCIDNSKVLRVTGLTKEDFLPIKEGIRIELAKLAEER